MALIAPVRSVARELRTIAIVTFAAITLVCAVWIWLAGFAATPLVLRNLPYGLIQSAIVTACASLLCNVAILLVRRRATWLRWSGYAAACVVAAFAGTFLTALTFHLLGYSSRAGVAINFEANIKAAVLVTLFVGGIVMGLHERRNLVEKILPDGERNDPEQPRIASRVGGKLEFVDLRAVSYVYAQDKLTFAVTPAKHHPLDLSITQLQRKAPTADWLRIHRSTLVNVKAVKGLHTDVTGRLHVRLTDGAELRVAKNRAAQVRAALKG